MGRLEAACSYLYRLLTCLRYGWRAYLVRQELDLELYAHRQRLQTKVKKVQAVFEAAEQIEKVARTRKIQLAPSQRLVVSALQVGIEELRKEMAQALS